MQPHPKSSYIARVADLAASDAELAFDQHAQALGGIVDVSSGTFRIVRVLRAPESRPDSLHAVRRAPGRLCPRPFGPSIAVELELVPWSHTRTEVGLRYTGRGLPGPGSRFFELGADAVESVVAALEAWSPATPAVDDGDIRAA